MKFIAKCKNQVLCMKPNRVQVVDGIPVPTPGEHVRFNNGEFETEDKRVIKFIKDHKLFNVDITEVEEVKDLKKKDE